MDCFKIFALISLLGMAGCKKETQIPANADSFIFGKACGECQGNCATFFKIENGKLFADLTDYFYHQDLSFDTVALPEDKYQIASNLLSEFPAYLENNPDKTFGCPDCADQCGFYIIVNKDGSKTYWNIDTVESNLPSEITTYINKLDEVLDMLK